MFKVIDLYIAKTLLSTIAVTLSVLIGLSALIKFVEQLRRIGQGDYDMTVAALYVFLSLPREIELFLPMATLLGGLIGMGLLAQNSELVVMQASGLSRTNITVSAMKSIVIVVISMMALGEFITPKSESKAKELRTEALSGGSLVSSGSRIWAKDGNDFVSISEVIDEDNLKFVEVFRFDDELVLTEIINAEFAEYIDDIWQLTNVNQTTFYAEKISNQRSNSMSWNSSLSPDKLGIVAVKPEALSVRGLIDYVGYLKNNDQESSRYELALWRKIFQPVSVVVMLLLAMSFIFGPLRSVSMGARTIMGVIAGFTFFISNEMFGQASLVFQLRPLYGALLPSLVFSVIAIYLLKRQ